MNLTRDESIRRQQDALAQILRDPIEQVTSDSIALWYQHNYVENILLVNFSRIPYCAGLYALNSEGLQITEYVCRNGVLTGSIGWDHSAKPYMNRVVPAWGFLLSDIYFSQRQQRPALTALQVVRRHDAVLGFIGVDFDLRDLPLTTEWFQDNRQWADLAPASADTAESQSTRRESPMDRNLDALLLSLEELLTCRGIFQCQLHFASSQVSIWPGNDPYQYRILEQAELAIRGTLSSYPLQDYPPKAKIPRRQIRTILARLRDLRQTKKPVYLRHASINIYNGMLSLGFSCDSTLYLSYEEFLDKASGNWLEKLDTADRTVLV